MSIPIENVMDYVIKEYGKRKAAIMLVSDRVFIHCGLTTSELPDSLELCNLYDEIETLLSDWEGNKNLIFELLDEIDFDFINELTN